MGHWFAASLRQEPLAPVTVLELSRRVQHWRSQPTGIEQAPCAMRRRALRARNQLACHNLRLVSHTWKRHRSALPLEAEDTADALQEGAIALLRAAELFDPARGNRFSTYATFWVRRGFNEHERRQRRLIRLPAHWLEILARVQALVAQHRAATGEVPSLEWLAARCGKSARPLTAERLRFLLIEAQRLRPQELDQPLWSSRQEGGAATRLDLIADGRGADPTFAAVAAREVADCQKLADFPDAEAQLADCAGDGHDEQRALLPQLLRVLSPRERRLIWHRYLREHPLSERQLQRVMGLAPAAQQAMEEAALGKLRRAAEEAGWRVPL